jgi:hypothetical protein
VTTTPDPDNAWYEAYAEAIHKIGKKWPDPLTDEENAACEAEADKVAPRPKDDIPTRREE